MSFTKNITVLTNGLQGPSGLNEIYIILSFDKVKPKTPFDGVPWMFAPFYPNKPEYQHMDATYVSNPEATEAVDDGQGGQKINPAGTDPAINVGQQIDPIKNEDPQSSGFAADNQNGDDSKYVPIGDGTSGDNGNVSPISAPQDVGNGASGDVQVTTIMSIFASVPDSGSIVQSHLKSLPSGINSLLWSHDLADKTLPSNLVFNLAWSAAKTEFVLTLVT